MNILAFPGPIQEDEVRPASPADTLLGRNILEAAGVDPVAALAAAERCATIGSELSDELIAAGDLDPETLARAIAQVMGLPFDLPGAHDRVVWRPAGSDLRMLRTCSPDLNARLFIAPRLAAVPRLSEWIEARGRHGIAITSSDALRRHDAAASAEDRSHAARFSLANERPDFSALTVLTAKQGYALGLATCAMLLAAHMLGSRLGTAFHIAISLFLFACTLFRILVLVDHRFGRARRRRSADRWAQLQLPVGQMPVYTVLVALYHETEMVEPLVASLSRLNWPRSRLDVKLVCEADDEPTIGAVRRHIDGEPGFELVQVPPSMPRTKPKALNYALPLARGEHIVLYDAEDRPDPDQLLEAWLAFRQGGPDLACVQAPLVIRNGAAGWLSGVFAFEYAVLFRAVLPFLARYGLPIPLGGTSNHFRRGALDHVGGWDSHNVAEDADLGIRLARCGYRVDIIDAPTSEIAPERFVDWRNQRSRWVKGWIQTYLVHMRQPGRALRELGLLNMLTVQLLFLSMVAGAVMHTVFVAHLLSQVLAFALGRAVTYEITILLAIDVFNIVAAASVFALLANEVLEKDERPLMRAAWSLWLYWFLVSLASLRAIRQLFADPHGWEKTPHATERPVATEAGQSPDGSRDRDGL